MAPLTRSSVMGRQPVQDQDEMQGLDDSDSNNMYTASDEDIMNSNDFSSNVHGASSQEESPEVPQESFQSSARELLRPLQETANRVSKQVEDFAKALDRFNADRQSTDQDLWRDAITLLDDYKQITDQRKEQTAAKKPKSKALQKNRKSLGDTDRELQNLQLEADLWVLISRVLICKSPQAITEAKESQQTVLPQLHRYSTNTELWNAFLDADAVAQEYEAILDWLQETADVNSPEIEGLVADLIKKSDRGDGIWSSGWIFTKDAIKKQKRPLVLSEPINPSKVTTDQARRRQEDGEPLVTQLDPDAASRQDALLELADEYYEAAAWQVCWEMLRRGWPLDKWRDWWTMRNEQWRGVMLRNSDHQQDQTQDKYWPRIVNIASNQDFTSRCKALSEGTLSDTFETAVLGILGGSYASASRGCQNIDDHLFALVNSLLIERYQNFLMIYNTKLKDPSARIFTPVPSSINAVNKFLQSALVEEQTKSEAADPHKAIESVIMGQDFDDFFIEIGRASAQVAVETGHFKSLFDHAQNRSLNERAIRIAQDQDSMRMVVHLQLILHTLGFLKKAYNDHSEEMDNNIVSYIGHLEESEQFSLIPLYASKLSPNRASRTLGPILVKVKDVQDRDLQIRLMRQYNLPIARIIYSVCEYARLALPESIDGLEDARYAARIIERKNKILKIGSNFLGSNTSPAEDDAVDAQQWTHYMDAKHWGMAVWTVTALYKTFLLLGKLAAAKRLAEEVRLSDVSLQAVAINLSLANAMGSAERDEDDMEESDADVVVPLSPQKKRKGTKENGSHPLTKAGVSRDALAEKSRIWAELEQLVVALVALENWQQQADEVEKSRNDLRQMKIAKKQLKDAIQGLQLAMQPLLEPDFLAEPNDEDENFVLSLIRNHYLPECVLAYNSALYFAGHALTREYLIDCMNLAQTVAQNTTLTSAFVISKRMQELVMAFAQDSQALIRANEAGSGHSKKTKKESLLGNAQGRADIWQVEWKEHEDVAGEHAE